MQASKVLENQGQQSPTQQQNLKAGFVVSSMEPQSDASSTLDNNVNTTEVDLDLDGELAGQPAGMGIWRRLSVWLVVGGVGLSVAELSLAFYHVLTASDWLGGAWLVLLAVTLVALGGFVVAEYRSLKHLKDLQEGRQYADDLFHTPAIGLAQSHCQQLAKQLPEVYQPLVRKWQDSLENHYSNSEVLSLFEHKVLAEIDKNATQHIQRHATAAGVMIAVSPFALLDMLIVLWRNLIMVNQLAALYGVKLGYWGRIALIKNIFRNMLLAGAMELLSDAGNYALGLGITGKLSTRLAQGLGAGVLTSRIGLRALNECRPIPFLALKKPGLSEMSGALLERLTRLVK